MSFAWLKEKISNEEGRGEQINSEGVGEKR